MTTLSSPVTRLLEDLNIAYAVIAISLDSERKPIRSLEQQIAEAGGNPACIVRSLVFRAGSGRFAVLAIPSGAQADWAKLRRRLDERRLTLADPEEVLTATGFPIGAVPPIALPEGVSVLIDEGVFAHAKVVIGSGVLGYALELASADLRRALAEAEIGQWAKA